MILFVTDYKEEYLKRLDLKLFNFISVVNVKEGLEIFKAKVKGKRHVNLDIEATGLNPYLSKMLLLGIKVSDITFIFDNTNDYTVLAELLQRKIIIGHNLNYDIKILYTHTGILLEKIYDTMIAEQRLYMGMGYSNSYADVVYRYTKNYVFKDDRQEFIGVNADTYRTKISHLQYLHKDLLYLTDIRNEQRRSMKSYQMEFLIYGIEFPLITTIAKAELTGFKLNKEKWEQQTKEEEENNYKILLELDAEFKKLRENAKAGGSDNVIYITGGKWDKVRKHSHLANNINTDKQFESLDLFGEISTGQSNNKKKVNIYEGAINYNSPTDIAWIFASLEEPMLNKYEELVYPKVVKKLQGKAITYKLSIPANTCSTKESILKKLKKNRPHSQMNHFIDLLMKYSKSCKSLSTYGKTFIKKINPATGRIHTKFNQCFTETGRFSSGGGKKEPELYNAQNIPRDNKYRNCFTTTEDKQLLTIDYSGAELIVMASHAQDFHLINLSKGDMHSHLAKRCWQSIYRNRALDLYNRYVANKAKLTDDQIERIKKLYAEYRQKATEFEVTKTLRQDFKPMGFGIIYGMYAKKAGATLNISKEEGQIVIDEIEDELPKTIGMVKRAAAYAKANGYVLHNSRTNSRRWFPILISRLDKEVSEKTHFIEISEALSAAKNSRIQGTQADFVKEATVVLRKRFKKLGLDDSCIILSWVHDELVIEIPRDILISADKEQFPFIGRSMYIPQLIKATLIEVANRYLENVTIDAEMEMNDYWLK